MLKKSLWTTLSSFAFALNSFLSNKLFSAFFGPEGITLLAHFQNIIAIFTTIPNEGINRAVANQIANPDLKQTGYNQILSAAVIMNFISFAVVFLFMAFSFFLYNNDFPSELFSFNYIIIILIGTLFHVFALTIANLLLSSHLVKGYAILSIINNVVAIGLVYFGLKNSLVWGLVFVSIAPGFILIFMLYYYYSKRKQWVQKFTFSLDKIAFKNTNAFIITAISVAVFGRIVDFFVREFVIKSYSSYETGLWQSVVKISDGYTTVFNAALGMLIFVKLSTFLNNKSELQSFLRKYLILIFIATTLGLSVLWLLREPVLIIFYNENFIKAEKYMFFQFLGDAFKFPGLILAFLMLSQMRIKLYVMLQALSACVYCVLVYIFTKYGNLEVLPMAHAARFILLFIILLFIYRNVYLENHKTD